MFIAGGGPIGVLVHLLVRLAGAGRIIVSDLHPARLATARAFGADIVVDAGSEDPVDVVREATGGSGADVDDRGRRLRRHARARPSTPCATRAPSSGSATASSRIEIGMQAVVTRDLDRARLLRHDRRRSSSARSQLLAAGRLPVDEIVNRYATLDEGPGLFEELLASPATIKCVIRP